MNTMNSNNGCKSITDTVTPQIAARSKPQTRFQLNTDRVPQAQPMNTKITTTFITRFCFVLGLALSLWSPLQAQSTQPMEMKTKIDGKVTTSCQEMKEKKEKMIADMKTEDAELLAQVAKMPSTPQYELLGLMTALVTHMAEQRTAMDERMLKLDREMMQHMKEHMQMGEDSVAQCPIMKDMAAKDAISDDVHKEHHADQK